MQSVEPVLENAIKTLQKVLDLRLVLVPVVVAKPEVMTLALAKVL